MTLHLTVKKKWFDMIRSREKKEEYRQIKEYWIKRLCCGNSIFDFHEFDKIKFTNGYGSKAPSFTIECKGIGIGKGKTEWGWDGNTCFVIELGNIL